MKGKFVVIAGPSASGKTELVRALLTKIPNSARLMTSTTRERRPGEYEDYFFISREVFEKGIEHGDFFEYAEVYGNLYGSSKKHLDELLATHSFVFAIIDVKGAQSLKSKIKDVTVIFISPGSMEAVEQRLRKVRATISKDELQKRLDTARYEVSLAPTFDHVVENKDGHFQEAVSTVINILLKD